MTVPKFKLNDSRLWHYRGVVTRVIDGDTLEMMIDRGFGNLQIERLRLAGVDTPELRPRKGTPEERDAERIAAKAAKARVIELVEGREVIVKSYKTGKFGRWIAEVFLPDDVITKLGKLSTGEGPTNIREVLLDEGHGVPYPKK